MKPGEKKRKGERGEKGKENKMSKKKVQQRGLHVPYIRRKSRF